MVRTYEPCSRGLFHSENALIQIDYNRGVASPPLMTLALRAVLSGADNAGGSHDVFLVTLL